MSAELLALQEHTISSLERVVLQLGDVIEEQKCEWREIAELRDEVHRLALALVRAGIPLDPPPLRSVS